MSKKRYGKNYSSGRESKKELSRIKPIN